MYRTPVTHYIHAVGIVLQRFQESISASQVNMMGFIFFSTLAVFRALNWTQDSKTQMFCPSFPQTGNRAELFSSLSNRIPSCHVQGHPPSKPTLCHTLPNASWKSTWANLSWSGCSEKLWEKSFQNEKDFLLFLLTISALKWSELWCGSLSIPAAVLWHEHGGTIPGGNAARSGLMRAQGWPGSGQYHGEKWLGQGRGWMFQLQIRLMFSALERISWDFSSSVCLVFDGNEGD